MALLGLEGVHRRTGGHDHHDDHDHDPRTSHDATTDPHLWLSVDNMALLAGAVGQRFPAGLHPGQPQQWQQAAADQLQAERERLAPLAQVPWLSYHQPWGYLSESLGLAEPLVVSEQLDAGPGSRRFVTLAGQVRDQQVRCAVQEPEARAGLLKRLCPDCYVQIRHNRNTCPGWRSSAPVSPSACARRAAECLVPERHAVAAWGAGLQVAYRDQVRRSGWRGIFWHRRRAHSFGLPLAHFLLFVFQIARFCTQGIESPVLVAGIQLHR